MEYKQEELQELIDGIDGDVTKTEKVYGGTRPVEVEYKLPDGRTVVENFTYHSPAGSDTWEAVLSITLTMQNNGIQIP